MKLVAGVAALVLLSGASALAQNRTPVPNPSAAHNVPCSWDLPHFCSAVQPGMGRKIACLNTHIAELRPDCRARINAINTVEAELAAKHHEPVAQFLAEAYARKAHDLIIPARQGTATPPAQASGKSMAAPGKPATPASNAQPGQTAPK
jgi:hypothetical protein